MIPFLDRNDELRRLRRFLGDRSAWLAVVYGRRRCGKSTLIQKVCGDKEVYFIADERDAAVQIQAFASEVARVLPGFDAARYPSWDSLFLAIGSQVDALTLAIDEFPYLVSASSELPSVIQRHIDRPPAKGRLRYLLSGSSQRMMHGLVLDRTAPLYGRAREILRITPLRPGWIGEALGVGGAAAVEAWSVWGGVPRYWELAHAHRDRLEALRDLVLDRHGVLHDEPHGLLLDDMRTASQAASILGLVGAGCHRLSEIAARLEKPAGSLSRPMMQLIELGYLRREVPFGEDPRSSKRALYRIDDPFMAFWYRFVEPARSLLSRGLLAPVEAGIEAAFPGFVAEAWEVLARESVPHLSIGGHAWGPASRWWGKGSEGPVEFDVVAESLDGEAVLVGEVKWTQRSDIARWRSELRTRAASAPFLRGRKVVHALWTRTGQSSDGVFTPDEVLSVLR